ncbi:MAG TPA: HAD family phosphatase [Candidatus Saccharimonadales bacterium]|nr:HAD family phosphatase [Candidatus Saccharimonadales bacterium]
MNKAFIFDLDGVVINDEHMWEEEKQKLYPRIFGLKVAHKLGPTLGVNIDGIYERAVSCGTTFAKAQLVDEFYKLADTIYRTAPITEGLNELVNLLKELNYELGIVSASPMAWITTVAKRLAFESDISTIISLYERNDLANKPEPDGYIEAMRTLKAMPTSTIILEDSNNGIQAAKASDAFTIALRQNLIQGYVQEGADVYADTIKDVIALVKLHSTQNYGGKPVSKTSLS